MQKGVTLVELAIVLVIIGLLISSVLAGEELIRQAEIRKDITNINSLRTESATFLAKYSELPGDFKKALTFFPECENIDVTTTCNGDGDGLIEGSEAFYLFEHLSWAKLIKGNYRFRDPDLINSSTIPVLESTGQLMFIIGSSNIANPFAGLAFSRGSYGENYFLVMGNNNGTLGLDDPEPDLKAVNPTIVASIDGKIDDGNGLTGIVKTLYSLDYADDADLCTNSSGIYKATSDDPKICLWSVRY